MSEIRSGYDYLLRWALSKPRKPAQIAFTEGDLRLVGYLIEEYDYQLLKRTHELMKDEVSPDDSGTA